MKHLLLTTIAAVVLVGCGESPPDISIHEAAFDGNIAAVKQHLAAGKDVNAKNDHGVTPLHVAAMCGNKETAKVLIANGADVSAKMKDARTPLNLAESKAHKETADLLRKHGGKTKKELKVEAKE
ncbi:MAG: ankyrin repeat domain-containing protein [Nitrospinaceae bacterium]|jgi:ankyrin repeat protein|nr:ankyrin repeat domain-containing protein [Nitrospinaceae bacterium]|tara:strand:- start:1295 stop:1669 length:375 start_codon:yes stop_codon:yes gene_type:complete